MNKKILIRSDSSINIGTGHVIRCLNLATLLKQQGHHIIFVCRELPGNVISLIQDRKFKVHILPYNKNTEGANTWLGVELEPEIFEFSNILEIEFPNFVIVDHYALGVEWERACLSKNPKLLVIDDIFRHHYCSALLDQNFQNDHTMKIHANSDAKLYLGPEYAILSENFIKQPKVRINKRAQNIVVAFGGIDSSGETARCLKILKKLNLPINIKCVVGKNTPHLAELENISKNTKIELFVQTEKMAAIMASSDVFIGAGGSTTWERCFLGLPALCISVAENQEKIAESLHEIKVHQYLGRANEISDEFIAKNITEIILNERMRREFSTNSLSLNVGSRTSELIEFFN